MSANLHSVENMGPAWNARPVVFFNGTYDTNIKTGADYETVTLASLFTLEPANADKMAGPAFIPSSYHDYDAREHGVQRVRGEYVALACDIDKGNASPRQVQDLVKAFCGDAAWLIYSSPNARPNDRRWRVIMPLATPCTFEDWHDAQNALFNFMGAAGVECDRALERAAQPVFLPNVPDMHKSGEALRDAAGNPLYYQRATTGTNAPGLSLDEGAVEAGIIQIRRKRAEDDAERERLRREAEKRRANRDTSATSGGDLIADFARSTTIATLLQAYDYKQCPRNPEDWRSTYQQGETYATRIMGDKWVSLSSSDASAGLGAQCSTGCYGDAYDLFVHFEHKGDHKAAFRQLHAERKAAAVPDSPPQWMNEIPTYDEPPEWLDTDAEPVFDEPATNGNATLPFEWAGQAAPVLDGLWLIDEWLPKTGICAVYGHPGSGKSFLTLDMGAHIAAGQNWAGRHTEQGLVVYVVAEGQTGFRNRLYAMQREGKIAPDAPFVFIPTPIDMQSPDGDLKILMETIHQVSEQCGKPIAMLVIDTLSKTFGAGKENTDDMAGYVSNCQRVSSAFDCLTVVVHHRPKDSESRDLRGHSSLRGGIETMILVEAGDIKTATTLKQKDGEDNIVVRFKLDRVVIGEDKRGKEISTCLTSIVDGVPQAEQQSPSDRRKARLTGHKKTALKAIEEVVAKTGVEPSTDIPADAIDRFKTWKAAHAGVVSDRLKNEFYALEDGDEDKRRDNARRNANRALKDLKAADIIGTWGDWIWVN